MNVQNLIEEIRNFMHESDHSLTSRLRRLHSAYLEFATDLNSQIEECKKISLRLSMVDAASHARSMDPPLDKRVEMMDFPERGDFISICSMYALAPLPEIDTDFVAKLSAPQNGGERQIGALLQTWRKTARTGTSSQRMDLLRQIVSTISGDKSAWIRNLMETEKLRYSEIAEELDSREWFQEDLEKLEKINMELHSPLLLTKPEASLITKLQTCLLPLQKNHLAMQVDAQLDEMQACYDARNDKALEDSFQEWKRLITHPLIDLSSSQRQFAADIQQYLDAQKLLQEKQRQYDELMADIKASLNANTPYPEIASLYNKLVLLDLPVPQSLQNDMTRLAEEFQANEHRLNVRRIAYGTLLALIALVLLFAAIFYLQYTNSVKSSMANMTAFLETQDYKGAIDYFESLKLKAPRIAKNSKLLALQADAQSNFERRQKEIKLARQEFAMLSESIAAEMSGDFLGNSQFAKTVDRLEQLRNELDEDGRKELTELLDTMTSRQKQLVLKHEEGFIARRDTIFKEMTEWTASMSSTTDLDALEAKLKSYIAAMDNMKADSTIDSGLRDVTLKQWEGHLESLNYALSKEKNKRQHQARLFAPDSFQTYAQTLEQVHLDFPGQLPAYSKAIASLKTWKAIMADLDAVRLYFNNRQPITLPQSHIGKNFLTYLQNNENVSFTPFASQVLQKCNYYELAACDEDGRKYFFYSKKLPLIERDKRNRKYIKNISVDIDAYSNVKDCFYVFVIHKREDGTEFFQDAMANYHANVQLPATFLSLGNYAKPEMCGLYKLAEAYMEMVKQDMPEEERLNAMLKKLPELENPFTKCEAALQILETLGKISALDQAEMQTKIDLIKQCNLPTSEWKNPDACLRHEADIQAFEEVLKNVNIEALLAAREFKWRFLGALYARNLIPAGVVTFSEDGSIRLTSFLKSQPAELYVFQDEQLMIIKSDLTKGKITAEQDNALLFNGQLLWTFSDGMTSEAFLSDWQKKASKQKTTLNLSPALCPPSLHYLLK